MDEEIVKEILAILKKKNCTVKEAKLILEHTVWAIEESPVQAKEE